ncbi:hypothetical protein [Nostoc sp.]
MAASNWGDRNHAKISALPNSPNAIPIATRMLTNPVAMFFVNA